LNSLKNVPESIKSFILSNERVSAPTQDQVTLEAKMADVDFLMKSLPFSYGGYDYAISKGFSWENSWKILGGAAMNPAINTGERWHQKIVEGFSGLPDRHFAVIRQGKEGSTRAYQAVGPTRTLDMAPKAPKKIFEIKDLGNGKFLVRASSFHSRKSKVWEEFVASAWSLRKAKEIILDLRSNSGGNSSKFLTWLKILTGKSLVSGSFRKVESPWTYLLSINYFTSQIAMGIGDQAWQDHCIKWRNKYLEILGQYTDSDLNTKKWFQYETKPHQMNVPTPTEPALPFGGKLVVAVDRFCTSACELALKALFQLPNTTVVGERTGGMAIIGENGRVILPGSLMAIKFGQWIETDLSKKIYGFEEGRGFRIDKKVDWSKVEITSLLN
jgi:hypothetical protein